MPSKNTLREDSPQSFYHVYARGASKQPIFLDTEDYRYFVNLFARYLSLQPKYDKSGVIYPHFHGKVELLSYCLMRNHFHMLIFQRDVREMSVFMKCVMSSYCRYFNLKYRRSGSIYESRFKASMITSDSYLLHISRYIHMNPRYWLRYEHSSLQLYLHRKNCEWISRDKVIELFENESDYLEFIRDYESHKQMIDEIKHELADH